MLIENKKKILMGLYSVSLSIDPVMGAAKNRWEKDRGGGGGLNSQRHNGNC